MHACAMTYSYARHDSLIHVTWLMCMSHRCVRITNKRNYIIGGPWQGRASFLFPALFLSLSLLLALIHLLSCLVTFSLSRSLPPSHSPALTRALSLFLSLSTSLSLSLFLSLIVSCSLSHTHFLFHSLCLTHSLSLTLCLSLFLCLLLSPFLPLSRSLCLSKVSSLLNLLYEMTTGPILKKFLSFWFHQQTCTLNNLIHICNMPHLYIRQDSFARGKWLIHKWDVIHS